MVLSRDSDSNPLRSRSSIDGGLFVSTENLTFVTLEFSPSELWLGGCFLSDVSLGTRIKVSVDVEETTHV